MCLAANGRKLRSGPFLSFVDNWRLQSAHKTRNLCSLPMTFVYISEYGMIGALQPSECCQSRTTTISGTIRITPLKLISGRQN